MFELLLGWWSKISHNLSHIILAWLLHCHAAPRQSAQSEQLSSQLPSLQSCVNIPGHLILSMGFKPHWHADESLIKWPAWDPKAVKGSISTEVLGTSACQPEECWTLSVLTAAPLEAHASRGEYWTALRFPTHSSLDTAKHATSRGRERSPVCALTRGDNWFSKRGKPTCTRQVQTQTPMRARWVLFANESAWKTWILHLSEVRVRSNHTRHPLPSLGHRTGVAWVHVC